MKAEIGAPSQRMTRISRSHQKLGSSKGEFFPAAFRGPEGGDFLQQPQESNTS